MEKKFHFLTKFVPSVDGDGEGVPGRVSACVFCVKRVCLSWRPRVCGFHAERRALHCGLPGEGLAAWPRPRRPGVNEPLQALVPVTSRCVPIHVQASLCLDVAHRPSAAGPGVPLGAQLPPSPHVAPCCASPAAPAHPVLPDPSRARSPPHGVCALLAPGSPLGLQAVVGPHSFRSSWPRSVQWTLGGAPRPKPDLAVLLMGPAPRGALLCPGPSGGPGCGQ